MRLARGGGATGRGGREGIEEAVDDLEDGALLGGRELGEALDALEEACDSRTGGVAERREAEELIGRHAESPRRWRNAARPFPNPSSVRSFLSAALPQKLVLRSRHSC